MRIITWNVNGLRSLLANNEDSLTLLFNLQPDIVCFQETKLSSDALDEIIIPTGYNIYHNISQNKGHHGVSIITKLPIKSISLDIGEERFDREGRFLSVKTKDNWEIVCLYMPHGKRDKSDIPYKLKVADRILYKIQNEWSEKTIICTDFNIAHTELDLARPRQNYKNTMFTQNEREIINKLDAIGIKDVYREKRKEKIEYTWWPYSFNARERNLGWRIDYFFINKKYLHRITDVRIKKEILGSDHCPLMIDINVN